MAKYIVRIELHGADNPEPYEVLHEFMRQYGFLKSLPVDDGYYPLPTAEYYIEHDSFDEISFYAHSSASVATADIRMGYEILFSELKSATLETTPPSPPQTIRC
ncbi:hypothetical protein GQC79_004480 [Salmonella enterica]|nr:hypothetical protein [Salmonella enterica]